MQAALGADHPGSKLKPWDWEYYAEKVRKAIKGIGTDEHTLNRVTVFLTDANVRVTGADGKVSMTQRKAGEAIWSAPAKHREENLNDTPFEVIAVEVKD